MEPNQPSLVAHFSIQHGCRMACAADRRSGWSPRRVRNAKRSSSRRCKWRRRSRQSRSAVRGVGQRTARRPMGCVAAYTGVLFPGSVTSAGVGSGVVVSRLQRRAGVCATCKCQVFGCCLARRQWFELFGGRRSRAGASGPRSGVESACAAGAGRRRAVGPARAGCRVRQCRTRSERAHAAQLLGWLLPRHVIGRHPPRHAGTIGEDARPRRHKPRTQARPRPTARRVPTNRGRSRALRPHARIQQRRRARRDGTRTVRGHDT